MCADFFPVVCDLTAAPDVPAAVPSAFVEDFCGIILITDDTSIPGIVSSSRRQSALTGQRRIGQETPLLRLRKGRYAPILLVAGHLAVVHRPEDRGPVQAVPQVPVDPRHPGQRLHALLAAPGCELGRGRAQAVLVVQLDAGNLVPGGLLSM